MVTLTDYEFDNVMAALRELDSQSSLGARQLKEKLLRKKQNEDVVLDLDNARTLTVISRGVKYKVQTMERNDGFCKLNGFDCYIEMQLTPLDRLKETATEERLRADLDYCKALLRDLADYGDGISRERAERFLKETKDKEEDD